MDSGGLVPLQATPGGPDFSFLIMMGAIFAIFYFIVIRPQQKQQREREAFLKTAARGDEVITQGGIHGRVSAVDGEVLEVEVARLRGEKIKLRISRAKIEQLTKGNPTEGNGKGDEA